MLNSWKKSGNSLPMPKREQDLDLSIEFQQVQSAGKSVKKSTLRSKVLAEPMLSEDILKLFGMESSPAVTKARKKLWSAQKNSTKKRNEHIKITANKENVRKSIFPKPSARRASAVKTNVADQTLPLIDMEDLEKHPHKINNSLRIPQSTGNNKTTLNPNAKRQTMYQSKIVKPGVKSNTSSQNKINDRPKVTDESKLKRQTVHQTRSVLKSIPEIAITNCNGIKEKSLPESGHENEREPVYDILKQILCRMDKLEMLIRDKFHCAKCHALVSPCKHEKTAVTESENENVKSQGSNTANIKQMTNDEIKQNKKGTAIVESNTKHGTRFIENNDKLVKDIVTDTTESIIQTTENVTGNTVSEIINNNIRNIENVKTENVNNVADNIERDTEYDNQNCLVQNLCSLFTRNDEEMTIVDTRSEDNVTNNQTLLQTENLIKPIELKMEEKDIDVCTNFTLLNATSDKTLHKSHFELLEAELQNASVTSLAFFDSDDSDSPIFQDINFDYLLGGKTADLTEINAVNGVKKLSTNDTHSSTGSNDAIRSYNEMRKTIPMLCTPKISKNNNASLFTPSIQNSHKKLLSRRIQEQLLMLNKK